MTGGPCRQHCGPAASFKLAHLSHSPLTLSSSCTSFTTVAEMHNCGMSYMHIPHISGRIVHICEGRCVNLFGEMRNCGLSWVQRCRQVNKGTGGTQVDTPSHSCAPWKYPDEHGRGSGGKSGDGDLCRLTAEQVWVLRQMFECRLHLPPAHNTQLGAAQTQNPKCTEIDTPRA